MRTNKDAIAGADGSYPVSVLYEGKEGQRPGNQLLPARRFKQARHETARFMLHAVKEALCLHVDGDIFVQKHGDALATVLPLARGKCCF